MTTTLMSALSAHPALGSLLIVLVVVVLHWPVRYQRRHDRHGREYVIVQSMMYRYSYGPHYERLDYDGMRQLQRIILELLRDAWALLRGDVLRRFVDELRKLAGL